LNQETRFIISLSFSIVKVFQYGDLGY
jgi:hypothetical protein